MGTEFAKHKMHFTIGLLAALFALHPFYAEFDRVNFVYMGQRIPVSYALMGIAVLLALAVYFYATALMSERPGTLSQRLGNWFYALAIMTVPLYAGMYATTLVEHRFDTRQILETPALTLGVLIFWLAVWQLGGWLIRRYLSHRDWTSQVDQLMDREMDALKRAQDLLAADHADLAIIQFHKAVLARLQMACMKRGYDSGNVVANARRAKIVTATNEKWLNTILEHAAVAQSTQPVERGWAAETAEAAKKFLATVAV